MGRNIDRIEFLDMAINMLTQAKISQKALEEIYDKADEEMKSKINDQIWARHIYQIIRGVMGIIEMNTTDLVLLSNQISELNLNDKE